MKNLSISPAIYVLGLFCLLSVSCVQNIKKEEPFVEFERQLSASSTDEMIVGDILNYWGADAPHAGLFFINEKADFLKSVGLKINSFKEADKEQEVLNKQISTSPIYQLELYQLKVPAFISPKNPEICNYVSENFAQATMIYKVFDISLRLKEREWIMINSKLEPSMLNFVRIGVAEPFELIRNNATDAFWLSARKSIKEWHQFTIPEKSEIKSWTCQEAVFIGQRSYEASYYNPDIVFQFGR